MYVFNNIKQTEIAVDKFCTIAIILTTLNMYEYVSGIYTIIMIIMIIITIDKFGSISIPLIMSGCKSAVLLLFS